MADYALRAKYWQMNIGTGILVKPAKWHRMGYVEQGIKDALKSVPKRKWLSAFHCIHGYGLKHRKRMQRWMRVKERQQIMPIKSQAQRWVWMKHSRFCSLPAYRQNGTIQTSNTMRNGEADGGVYKIWLEDTASLEEKTETDQEQSAGRCCRVETWLGKFQHMGFDSSICKLIGKGHLLWHIAWEYMYAKGDVFLRFKGKTNEREDQREKIVVVRKMGFCYYLRVCRDHCSRQENRGISEIPEIKRGGNKRKIKGESRERRTDRLFWIPGMGARDPGKNWDTGNKGKGNEPVHRKSRTASEKKLGSR